MAYPVRSIKPATATAVTDSGATEAVVLVGSPISTTTAEDTISLYGMVDITAGTAATAVVVKIRRGSTTSGAQVGSSITKGVSGGSVHTVPIEVVDHPGLVAGETYCVTVTETSATANGTVSYAFLAGYEA